VDCSLQELADDYNIPVEYIIDRVLELGVSLPVHSTDLMKDRLTTAEVEGMLAWLTTFDTHDVYDSYSDRPVLEIAEDYGIAPQHMHTLCSRLGIFLAIGLDTRLTRDTEEQLVALLEDTSNIISSSPTSSSAQSPPSSPPPATPPAPPG